MSSKKPVVLIIRDGWGDNPGGPEAAEAVGDCPRLANTPFTDLLHQRYPVAHLSCSGLDVGLPEGQMGNSEVGHLNLGAGRIVYQDFTRINKAVAEGELATNPVLKEAFTKAAGTRLHLLGLVSDGGVHSHLDHLVALAAAAKHAGVADVMVHAITDGRDTSPTGGQGYLRQCEERLAPFGAKIATVVGRYHAMDRDKRWERTALAWDAIVNGRGEARTDRPSEAVVSKYAEGTTDEFLPAMVFGVSGERRVRDGDVVLFFNFRADRVRQLSLAFLREDFDCFDRDGRPEVAYYTMTEYDETYGCPVVFPPQELGNTLGEVVSRAGLKQLRLAETEKYPHVSFFFNGGVEVENAGEDREMLPSPRDVATYDLKPEMSAEELTRTLLDRVADYDLVIVNYANPDMVGHTGSVPAAIRAVECVDDCVRRVVEKVLSLGGCLLITADHGNCEVMINPDGSPQTAHTTNPVPLIYVGDDAAGLDLESGILADIAPTILSLLGLDPPAEMTGHKLLIKRESELPSISKPEVLGAPSDEAVTAPPTGEDSQKRVDIPGEAAKLKAPEPKAVTPFPVDPPLTMQAETPDTQDAPEAAGDAPVSPDAETQDAPKPADDATVSPDAETQDAPDTTGDAPVSPNAETQDVPEAADDATVSPNAETQDVPEAADDATDSPDAEEETPHFHDLGLPHTVLRAVDKAGYETPTPIQAKSIPAVLEGRDVIGASQTGTGKTAAFALPIISRLAPGTKPQCLVLEPTRELAAQVVDQMEMFSFYKPLNVLLLHGGVGYGHQVEGIENQPDIVVATPGRLLDHLEKGNLAFDAIRFLVLDEVDRMLDMGFLPDVKRIIDQCPRERQTLFFSATMPAAIQTLANWALRDPLSVAVGGGRSPAETVSHAFYPVAMDQRDDLILALVRKTGYESMMIFTRTKKEADTLFALLKELDGTRPTALHSDIRQSDRTKALQGFRDGTFNIIVATDIAARGLDISGVTHVINYRVPENPEDYVHRIGRTGRARQEGDAFTILTADELENAASVEHFIEQKVERRKLEGFDYHYTALLDENPTPVRRRRSGPKRRR